jgi:hypothetical protein
VSTEDGKESFVGGIGKDEKVAHLGKIGDSFVVRGPWNKSNGGFRARVQIQKGTTNAAGQTFSYKIVFQAMAKEASAGPIELAHATPKGQEYIWIESGHQLAHYSQANNPFEIRDKNSNPTFKVIVFDHRDHHEL